MTRQSHDIGELGDRIEARLAAGGRRPRSRDARDFAYARVEAAINLLCPELFPLITTAEERVSGTRAMPLLPGGALSARGDRYELTGIVDVISSVSAGAHATNPIVQLIQGVVPPFTQTYDLIVDYKAARRPDRQSRYWQHHEWQVQTYAWLRRQTPNAQAVGAGMIVYISELSPSKTDLLEYKREIQNNSADVVPAPGSADYYAIYRWQGGNPLPQLSVEFRLRRAIRVIDVSDPLVATAVGRIDIEVSSIEGSAASEFTTGNIPANWAPCGEEQDCVACDFKHFCPSPAQLRVPNPPPRTPPDAPG